MKKIIPIIIIMVSMGSCATPMQIQQRGERIQARHEAELIRIANDTIPRPVQTSINIGYGNNFYNPYLYINPYRSFYQPRPVYRKVVRRNRSITRHRPKVTRTRTTRRN